MDKVPNNRMNIGPQYAKDNPFAARMRFHQSWYRSEFLRVPYGTGPRPSSTVFYGNMLTPEDGERGLNFLTPHIFEVVKRRLAIKKGFIDPFRLFCNMLSSQPMCFNVFGPLVDNRKLATALMQAILPGEIQTVSKVLFEFAPEPARDYLNDRTAFDAFISFTRPDNQSGFIGIETKLVEAFSPRLQSIDVNQLWRDHMLAVAMLLAPGSPFESGQFLLVYHPLDVECVNALNVYKQLLKPEDRSFTAMPLDILVDRWKQSVSTSAEKQWLDRLSLRYLDLQASDTEYMVEKVR
jgi:hypothetical protein